LHSDARANFAAAQKRIANPPKDWKSAECPLISTEFQCFNQHRTVPKHSGGIINERPFNALRRDQRPAW